MFGFDQIEVKKSYSPIKPGVSVAVRLNKVELGKDGDLDFHFEGTDIDNAGSYKPRFWISDFDNTVNDRYANLTDEQKVYADKGSADKKIQLKRLLQAYLTADQLSAIKGNSVPEWYGAIAQAMNPGVTAEVDATMKIVLTWNSDTDCEIPRYGDYISTPMAPRGLSLNSTKNKKGLPFDRVLPMSEYGIVADGGAPAAAPGAFPPTPGAAPAPTVPGGAKDSALPF